MTKKELEQRVKELEQERDIWRDMMSKFIKALPIINPVVLPPVVSPQTWPPFTQPTIAPLPPYMPLPMEPYTITCRSALLSDTVGCAQLTGTGFATN